MKLLGSDKQKLNLIITYSLRPLLSVVGKGTRIKTNINTWTPLETMIDKVLQFLECTAINVYLLLTHSIGIFK
jgi:hypothetical protein